MTNHPIDGQFSSIWRYRFYMNIILVFFPNFTELLEMKMSECDVKLSWLKVKESLVEKPQFLGKTWFKYIIDLFQLERLLANQSECLGLIGQKTREGGVKQTSSQMPHHPLIQDQRRRTISDLYQLGLNAIVVRVVR